MSTIYQLMKKQSGDKSLKTAIPTAYPQDFDHGKLIVCAFINNL